ncbi:MAG: hypothetical protein E7537_04570 [Ruminococcaceae bacterium]|nr:hypothetical protein [Oscillospiraceae bacterium]
MNNNFPIPITNENDLTYYQDYLNSEFENNDFQTENNYFNEFLGCLVEIEFISHLANNNKIGILENFNKNFITINLQNKNKTIIAVKCIKSITILQNKTKSPYY